MPVRNLVALWVASLAGFFLGLIEAMLRLAYGETVQLSEVGLAITLAVALAMAVGVGARLRERALVAALRCGLSGGVFVFIFDGLRLLGKLGDVPLALAAWIFAGILALLLARLQPAGGTRRPPGRPASGARRHRAMLERRRETDAA